jgi:hypothetical protein
MRFDRLPHHATARWLVPLLVLLGVRLLVPGSAAAVAQRGTVGSTVTYPAGWNLVSFADSTSFSPNPALIGPLFTPWALPAAI